MQAVRDISLKIPAGIVFSVIGPNGAGKSTLLNLMSGIYQPDAGTHDISMGSISWAWPAQRRVRHGLARTFQKIRLFKQLSVLENVIAGFHTRHDIPAWQYIVHGAAFRRDHKRCRDEATDLLTFVGLSGRSQMTAGSLSYGEQRMLEIARALATAPRLLMIDEPAAGLNAVEVDALLTRIAKLRERGITVVMVEHNMDLVMTDRGPHYRHGLRPVFVRRRAGRGARPPWRDRRLSGSGSPMTALLSAEGLELAYGQVPACRNISFHVEEGEVVTLIGANGAGKSTTLRAVAGALIPRAGVIRFQGRDITRLRSDERTNLGIALVPEGRHVFPFLTVRENLELGGFKFRKEGTRVRTLIEQMFAMFPRLSARASQNAGTLSGGEQQMLVLGRAMMSEPRLLCLDEPSLGLAPMIVQDIFRTIRSINAAGTSVLLVEQNARYALRDGEPRLRLADRVDYRIGLMQRI